MCISHDTAHIARATQEYTLSCYFRFKCKHILPCTMYTKYTNLPADIFAERDCAEIRLDPADTTVTQIK